MAPAEIQGGKGYEHNTGEVIVREFHARGLDPMDMPAALVRGHAPFVWGKDAASAVHNAVVLEEVAGMATHTPFCLPNWARFPRRSWTNISNASTGRRPITGRNSLGPAILPEQRLARRAE